MPSEKAFSSLTQSYCSILPIFESLLSETKTLQESRTKDVELDLRKTISNIKKTLQNPQAFFEHIFETRIEELFFKSDKIERMEYFEALWVYLLCCYFSIRHRGSLGKSFPPDDEDFLKFQERLLESTESDVIEIGNGNHESKKALKVTRRFFEDADKKFFVDIEQETAFVVLAYYCKRISLMYFWVSEIRYFRDNPNIPSAGHPWSETINKSREEQGFFEGITDVIDGWARALASRVEQAIGVWKYRQGLVEKSGRKRQEKTEESSQKILELYHRTPEITAEDSLHAAAVKIQKRLEVSLSVKTIERRLRENISRYQK